MKQAKYLAIVLFFLSTVASAIELPQGADKPTDNAIDAVLFKALLNYIDTEENGASEHKVEVLDDSGLGSMRIGVELEDSVFSCEFIEHDDAASFFCAREKRSKE